MIRILKLIVFILITTQATKASAEYRELIASHQRICMVGDYEAACWNEGGSVFFRAPVLSTSTHAKIAMEHNHLCFFDGVYLRCWYVNQDEPVSLSAPSYSVSLDQSTAHAITELSVSRLNFGCFSTTNAVRCWANEPRLADPRVNFAYELTNKDLGLTGQLRGLAVGQNESCILSNEQNYQCWQNFPQSSFSLLGGGLDKRLGDKATYGEIPRVGIRTLRVNSAILKPTMIQPTRVIGYEFVFVNATEVKFGAKVPSIPISNITSFTTPLFLRSFEFCYIALNKLQCFDRQRKNIEVNLPALKPQKVVIADQRIYILDKDLGLISAAYNESMRRIERVDSTQEPMLLNLGFVLNLNDYLSHTFAFLYKEKKTFLQHVLTKSANISKEANLMTLLLLDSWFASIDSEAIKKLIPQIRLLANNMKYFMEVQTFTDIAYTEGVAKQVFLILNDLLQIVRPQLSIVGKQEVDVINRQLVDVMSGDISDIEALVVSLRNAQALQGELNQTRMLPFAGVLQNIKMWLDYHLNKGINL